MKLYGYWRSSATYRVRIILELKGIDYEYIPVNLLKGEQSTETYRARNPQGLVPALDVDGRNILTQSLAITEYLEEAYPDPALLPDDVIARAQARAIAAIVACEGQPFMNLSVQKYLKEERDFDAPMMLDWLDRFPGKAMRTIETLIEHGTGAFCFGDQPGLAEAFLVPQVYGARRFGIDLSGLPRIVGICDRCNTLAAFQRALPDRQPDAPPA